MKLITKEIEQAFAKQGDTSEFEMKDTKIICKLFNPSGVGDWFLFEKIDDDVYMCFANLGDPQCAEIGTVSMKELTSYRGSFGLGIERDSSFEIGSKTLEQVWNEIKGK